MAEFEPQVADFNKINDGKRYENGDGVGAEAINSAIEASWFASYLASNQPVYQETTDGQPKVSIEYDSSRGLPYFVFYNMKGKDGKVEDIYQSMGDSENGVMSQKATTIELQKNATNISQAQKDIENLYAISSGAGIYTVTTIKQKYTSRQTANGENIIDGQYSPVLEITGDTVDCKNLIPYPYAETTKTMNGVTFTDNGDGSITIKGTASGYPLFTLTSTFNFTAGQTYTISQNIEGVHLLIAYGDEDGVTKYFSSEDLTGTFTWQSTYSLISIYIQINDGTEVDGLLKPMVNKGSTALPYQPYFTGYKNAWFKGIDSKGRNLIPYPYAETTKTMNGVTFTDNGDGSITIKGTASGYPLFTLTSTFNFTAGQTYTISQNIEGVHLLIAYGDEDGVTKYFSSEDLTGTFTWQSTYSLISIYIQINDGTEVDGILNPMLNEGSTALPVGSYVKDTYRLPQAIELAKWDKFNPQTGELVKGTKKVVFNGRESWWAYTSDVPDNVRVYATDIQKKAGYNKSFCNQFKYVKASWQYANIGVFSDHPTTGFLYFNTDISTVDAWKAHLAALYASGTPLVVESEALEEDVVTETLLNIPKSYKVWAYGTETIVQGEIDNSKYGAENTITQEYFELTEASND